MYYYATIVEILQSGCHYIILKFWFENDTLIQVRYCHLLGIWYVFIVGMLFSSSYFSNPGRNYVFKRLEDNFKRIHTEHNLMPDGFLCKTQ